MPVSTPGLRLSRSRRLRSRGDFAVLRAEGQRLACGCLILNYRPRPPAGRSRLGVVASRQIGSAVVRNRARRLLREVFRLHQPELCRPIDLVLVARASIAGKGFGQVERDYLSGLRRARLLPGT